MREERVDDEVLPQLARSARALGVRSVQAEELMEGADITIDMHGLVHPGKGGVSVNPNLLDLDIPQLLADHLLSQVRLPRHLGGRSIDPLWRLSSVDLPNELSYRADARNPIAHGFIEPSRAMTLDEYEQAIASTLCAWERIVV